MYLHTSVQHGLTVGLFVTLLYLVHRYVCADREIQLSSDEVAPE